MIKAVIFDLDNTLVDFMSMKRQAVAAAIHSMIDAGLGLSPGTRSGHASTPSTRNAGIEFQNVFDQLLYDVFQKVDYKILSAGIIAYRRAREAALVPYPHVNMTLARAAEARDQARGGLRRSRPRGVAPALLSEFSPSLRSWSSRSKTPGSANRAPRRFRRALELLGVEAQETHHGRRLGRNATWWGRQPSA